MMKKNRHSIWKFSAFEALMSQKWRKPLISDQLGPQRRRAGGFNGSNLMVGSQPASSTATDLTSERICCCRPLRTCPSAMAIITAAASFARAFNFACPRMVVTFSSVTLIEETEDPFHCTARIVTPAPTQGSIRSGRGDSAIYLFSFTRTV